MRQYAVRGTVTGTGYGYWRLVHLTSGSSRPISQFFLGNVPLATTSFFSLHIQVFCMLALEEFQFGLVCAWSNYQTRIMPPILLVARCHCATSARKQPQQTHATYNCLAFLTSSRSLICISIYFYAYIANYGQALNKTRLARTCQELYSAAARLALCLAMALPVPLTLS